MQLLVKLLLGLLVKGASVGVGDKVDSVGAFRVAKVDHVAKVESYGAASAVGDIESYGAAGAVDKVESTGAASAVDKVESTGAASTVDQFGAF